MSADTFELNQSRQALSDLDEIWLFGYGSLIYKVDFPYIEQTPAYITGWQRRFWQGSHDHRGTPENPGRVVTLIPSENARCDGMAFKVTADVFMHLDHREKNGYLRHQVPLTLLNQKPDAQHTLGLIYIADEHNAAFLGEASELDIAKQVLSCKGPSGENHEYVLQLANALRALNADDGHVFAIEQHLLELTE